MAGREFLAACLVLAVLGLGLPVIRAAALRLGASPEVSRKTVHILMGLICASFPWIFERPLPVWLLACCATVPLACMRIPRWSAGIGSVLHGVSRPSYGEILFAPAVATVFHLADGDPLLYVIPVGILTLADAAGALAGTRWGAVRYGCGDGFKTVLGSLVFCVIAFLCVFLPLHFGGRTDAAHALWIGLTLAILAMMAEGLADRGFDNLIIPLGCFLILSRLLPLDAAALAWRFLAAVAVLLCVLAGSRWSTLNGGALLGGALLGYGCAVLGDFRFVLPLLAIFCCHVRIGHRHRLSGILEHRLDAVLAHAIGSLPWVVLVELGTIPPATGLAGVSFSMAALLGMLHMAEHWRRDGRPAGPLHPWAKGWLIAATPGLIWLWRDLGPLLTPLLFALVTTALGISLLRSPPAALVLHPTRLWVLKGSVALLSSLPALCFRP